MFEDIESISEKELQAGRCQRVFVYPVAHGNIHATREFEDVPLSSVGMIKLGGHWQCVEDMDCVVSKNRMNPDAAFDEWLEHIA